MIQETLRTAMGRQEAHVAHRQVPGEDLSKFLGGASRAKAPDHIWWPGGQDLTDQVSQSDAIVPLANL